MSQMGINLQLVDVIYPCGEGWDGAELASSPHYACCEGAWVPLLEELRVLSVPFRGKQRQSTP